MSDRYLPRTFLAGAFASAAWGALVLIASPASWAADSAEQMMQKAHEGRAVWKNLPGFSAELSASTGGRKTVGVLKVAADGKVTVKLSQTEGFEWVERTLSSVVNHRRADGDAVGNVAFADEDAANPLGRLIKSRDEADHNQWRVKDDVLTEVHRDMGKTRFIISVVDVARNKEGKHLPRNFTVTTWDSASGAIVSARQVYNEWTRVGDFDLPARLLAVNSKGDGTRQVEEVVLSNHRLASANASALKSRELAPLKAPVTSFGAAIIDDELYIYGGQLGSSHAYSSDLQANRLLKLNLAKPSEWQDLGKGPRRTGLAMVSHGGKLYRLGGWEARNRESEKQNLHSSPDFASYDPKTEKWTDLVPMPSGRSSHDAAMIGSKLFVVGGWELGGPGDGSWHETALVCDLAAPKLEWKETAKPPFSRRALAVAGYAGKLYVIGGMNDSNETVTAVAIYDPATDKWSEGPAIPGKGFDGFGTAAFGGESGLYATTSPGRLYRLTAESKEWQELGDLAHPRTFHRLLVGSADSLVVVGGTSRPLGKVREVEVITISSDLAKRATR